MKTKIFLIITTIFLITVSVFFIYQNLQDQPASSGNNPIFPSPGGSSLPNLGPTQNKLQGTWKLTSFKDLPSGKVETQPEPGPNIPKQGVEIIFEGTKSEGSITGHTVTNTISGEYKILGSNRIDISVGGTEAYETDWGAKFRTAINNVSSYEVDGSYLFLYYNNSQKVMEFAENTETNKTSSLNQEPPKNKTDCLQAGGKWQLTTKPGNAHFCNLPTTDGGKKCTDSSQCQSYCQAPENAVTGKKTTGKCYAWQNVPENCFRTVNNGVADALACY